ncbi:polysaccharide pyruvyl transferase family protein [Ruminococcus flavefaciens]|nr:polysaccharide pyruvyl transferase family protein [Ruminococcus flavefaciens]
MYGVLRDLNKYIHQKPWPGGISSKKHFWFIDAPEYGNLGDQAIAYATTCFLTENFADFDVIEIQQSRTAQYINWLKKNIKPDDIIVLQGGGNFGNLYPPYEAVRRKIIKTFSGNKIIIFPQSIYYTNDRKGKRELRIAQKIYASDNLIIFARDKKSYSDFSVLFPKAQIGICPDIVFYLYGRILNDKKNGLGLCFRNDSEKTIFTESESGFIEESKKKYDKIRLLDTICKDNFIVGDKREQLVCSKIREFAENELVLTDRLHGMIFSFISKTSCVYFPSKTGKTEFLYDSWLSESRMIADHENYNHEFEIEEYKFDFSELIKAIMGD